MQTFAQWLKATHNMDLPKGTVNGAWFMRHNFPMVVECKCCTATMALPSCYVDKNGFTYCTSCAKGDE